MKDYFEYPDLIPKKVKAVLDSLESDGCSYEELHKATQEVELWGWEFEYGLNAVPYNLRPIKKSGRGGFRPGAGGVAKYNEETVSISFRCPISKVEEIKAMVKNKLKEYEKSI